MYAFRESFIALSPVASVVLRSVFDVRMLVGGAVVADQIQRLVLQRLPIDLRADSNDHSVTRLDSFGVSGTFVEDFAPARSFSSDYRQRTQPVSREP